MKKINLWAGSLWAALAISSVAAPVTQVTALQMAHGWMTERNSHLGARLRANVKSTESFPGFYLIHLAPAGFIVTAADDDFEPVLAFSDQGDLKFDPENPLLLLLNRHLPAQVKQLAAVRARWAPGRLPAARSRNPDDVVMLTAARAKAKWARYESAQTALAASAPVGANAPPGPVLAAASGVTNLGNSNPVHILDLRVVNGHVQLTHDANVSVTIMASYDSGQTWNVQDEGVVWPVWTSKQPAREVMAWYRVVPDYIYDETAVSLMRNPPPPTTLPDTNAMPSAFASDPPLSESTGSLGSVSDLRVAPLLQSAWNQTTEQGNNCYNYYTPNNYYDGCVATALGQLMRFWQYPTSGIGQVTKTVYVNGQSRSATTRGGNGSGGAYNWSLMPLSPSSVAYNASQWQMIGSLCYDAGVAVDMQYSSGGSGAIMCQSAAALSSIFHYSEAQFVNYPSDLITPTAANLAAGCPVLFGISSTSSGEGHAIVCDGFGYDSGALYFHINFGWDGAYNAWYVLPYLSTPYNFNSVDTIIYNAFPSSTGELLTGRVMSAQGAPIAGATLMATAGGQSYSATSDSKGYYGIHTPSGRSYTVTASAPGMGTMSKTGVSVGTSSSTVCGDAVGVSFTLNHSFSLTAVGLTTNVWLRWSAPTNCGMPTNLVYIRARTDRYPTNSTDGTLVYSGTAQVYDDTNVDTSGTATNYYTIWGNNGSPYASLGSTVNASSLADPGTARFIWTGANGEVTFWNLRANGAKKSAGYVTSQVMDLTYWSIAGFADIDGDGVSDLLWIGAGHEVVYWLLNADGTLKSSGSVTPGVAPRGGVYTVAGFGDINGDGAADVVWQGSDGTISYWMLNANGTRASSGLTTPGVAPRSGHYAGAGFGDINGDGTPDILWQGSDGTISYWMLNADGTRKSSGLVTPGVAPRAGQYTAAGFQDINGDGVPDIIWVGASGSVSYWMMNSDGSRKSSGLVTSTNLSPANYWAAAGMVDLNRDGVPDIVWRGQGGETIGWLLNSNGTFKATANIGPVPMSPSYWTIRAVAAH